MDSVDFIPNRLLRLSQLWIICGFFALKRDFHVHHASLFVCVAPPETETYGFLWPSGIRILLTLSSETSSHFQLAPAFCSLLTQKAGLSAEGLAQSCVMT
jgi:hypothetical protein